MKSKNSKIAVNIILLLSFILALISWKDNLTIHIIGGIAFALISTYHVFLNRKWLLSVSKTFKAGKPSKRMKWQYIIDLLLVVVWSITILSGLLTIGLAVRENEDLLVFSRFHNISSKLGCFLIIVHIFQHRKQISSYFKRKKM